MNYHPIIHLIDDDPVIREALTILLESEGYTVRAYDSARPFLDIIQPADSSCILTDIRMPEMNGLDLLKALHERGIFIPTILMSGRFNNGLVMQAIERGAFFFLEKPFDPEVLLSAIYKAVTRSNDAKAT